MSTSNKECSLLNHFNMCHGRIHRFHTHSFCHNVIQDLAYKLKPHRTTWGTNYNTCLVLQAISLKTTPASFRRNSKVSLTTCYRPSRSQLKTQSLKLAHSNRCHWDQIMVMGDGTEGVHCPFSITESIQSHHVSLRLVSAHYKCQSYQIECRWLNNKL